MEIRMLKLVVFGLCLNLCRSASGATLFSVGQEYAYNYETLVTAGAEEPVSHASTYKLKGKLLVTAVSTSTLSVGLDDLTVGLYNGPWSYFPIPEVQYFPSADLAPLADRFHITIEDGKVKSVTLNDQEPEWASNMKRGLATFLQMDLKAVTFTELQVMEVNEMTTMGECRTQYEVLPSTTTMNRLTRVSKFRNHADCPDVPTRTRSATHIFYPCPDRQTRDIMNSTAYSNYEMEVKDGQALLKQLTVFSSVLYWPFTSSGPYQFSWLNMTLTLASVSRFGNKAFPPPPNAEIHEDLTYIFEQSDPIIDAEDENPELKTETLFFHHIAVDSDPETYRKTVEQCHKVIAETAESLAKSNTYESNPERFHSNSPFGFIPLIASLDYDNLKQCYTKYSQAASTSQLKLTEFQLFLDGLILSGTTPSALVIRDILLSTTDLAVLTRLAPAIPHFIRNPTEALAKEMDPLFELVNKVEISETIRRSVGFSMASLIGRCCRKTNCTVTGLLDKYINHFESKLGTATNFKDRTVALHGLRNIKYGRALEKVLDIAAGKLIYEKPVRIQAIWSLRSLAYQDRARVFSSLLPVFYNRSESCEVRTSVFGFLMSVGPDQRVVHEIAYFMWTETCPQTINMVRSFLVNAVKSENPCSGNLGSYARTILKYLPPVPLDPLRTSSYAVDYYDKEYGFGHQIYSTVQRCGKSALPLSVYLGLNNYIGGFGSSYFGMYVRMEGLGEAISTKIASMRSTNVAEIKKILSQIGVWERPSRPVVLELTLVYHDYVILHYAADESDLSKLPAFLKQFGTLAENVVWNWERSVMLGGVFYQFPLEIGTPVSITASVTGIGSIANNITRTKGEGSYSQDSSLRLQFHLFGISQITNHAPSIGTMHSVSSHRTLRLLVPRHITLGFDKSGLNVAFDPPSQKNPILAMTHATSLTSLAADSPTPVKNEQALEKLKKSCSQCNLQATISRGPQFRKSRVLPLKLPSFVRGMTGEVKYYDCERDHSRTTVIRKFSDFFSGGNKNTGLYNLPLSNLFLSFKHARDYIFLSPYAETCGISAKIAQDDKAATKLERVEGQVKGTFVLAKDGTQNMNASISSKLDLKYTGTKPSTTKLKLNLEVNQASLESQSLKIKLEANDEALEQHGVICIHVENNAKILTKDVLDFQGENEPRVEQKIHVTMGRVPKEDLNKGEPSCLTNQADIKVVSTAVRSAEQKAEADSDISPYKECRSQKGSSSYPGPYVPPSPQCYAAVLEQTTLRAGNATVTYKLSQEMRNKGKRNLALVFGLLSAYSVDDTSDEHAHPTKSTKVSGVFESELEVGLNVRKDGPLLDIHYRDITGGTPEEHFHGIELSLLPAFLRPRPVPARISPFWTLAFQTGAYSRCSVTPSIVTTLDGFTYSADLTDCWTLISGDCGPNSQYLVLGKRVSAEKIAILVHIGENKIEFNGTPDAILDGKPVTLVDKQNYIPADGEALTFDVFKNGGEVYIAATVTGVYIRYTGHFVTITLSSRYRGLQCGLCGHWDYSPYNDLAGPELSCPSLLSPQNMVKAYVVNEGRCAAVGNQCPA